MALTDKINDGFRQLATLVKGKVDKTAIIDLAHGGTGTTTLTAAQTSLGVDKVVSANTRLTTAKQTFPNVYVDSNGQLQKTQFATWLDHAKMYNGLVPNGSFQTGDGSDWAIGGTRTLDTVDFPFGALASASITGDATKPWGKVYINPYQKYRHSIMARYIKNTATGGGVSMGFRCFDVDNNLITLLHTQHQTGTVTTLAQDLKIGDTKVYLTSLANWLPTTGTLGYELGFKFYSYVDSRGYFYDPSIMPYSRYIALDGANGWWVKDASSFDTANNVITLNKPWSYANPKDAQGIWRAGTKIAQTKGNGVASGTSLVESSWMGGKSGDTQWVYFEKTIGGVNTTGIDDPTKFPPGAASIDFTMNSSTPVGDTIKFSSHYFEKI